MTSLILYTDETENMARIIHDELSPLVSSAIKHGIVSDDMLSQIFAQLGGLINTSLHTLSAAIESTDSGDARIVLDKFADVETLSQQALEVQSGQLTDISTTSIDGFRLELKALEKLKRIYLHACAIAERIVRKDGVK